MNRGFKFSHNTKIILGILVFGLLIRLALFFLVSGQPEKYMTDDGTHYLNLSKNIFEQWIYSTSMGPPYKPEAFRPPLFPIIIGIPFFVLGLPVETILVFQIILSLIIAYVAYLLTTEFFGIEVGCLAAALVIFEGSFAVHSVLFYTEILFTLSIVLSVYYSVKYIRTSKNRYLCFSLLFWGISCYIRIASLYLGLILIAAIVLSSTGNLKYKLRTAILSILLVLLIAMPWVIRNYIKFGVFAFSTGRNSILYYHKAASIESMSSNISFEDVQMKRLEKAMEETGTKDYKYVFRPFSKDIDDYYFKESIKYLVNNPIELLAVEAIGAIRLQVSPGFGYLSSILGMKSISKSEVIRSVITGFKDWRYLLLFIFLVFQGFYLISFNLGLIYGIVKMRGNIKALAPVILASLYLILAAADFTSNSRFRIPYLPLLAVISAYGIYSAFSRPKPRIKSSGIIRK
jgi:4-amino-4-deoxy-L-arabinose transferase-like glycosyltransferase